MWDLRRAGLVRGTSRPKVVDEETPSRSRSRFIDNARLLGVARGSEKY